MISMLGFSGLGNGGTRIRGIYVAPGDVACATSVENIFDYFQELLDFWNFPLYIGAYFDGHLCL